MSKAEAKDKDGLSGVQPGLPTGGRGVCTRDGGPKGGVSVSRRGSK